MLYVKDEFQIGCLLPSALALRQHATPRWPRHHAFSSCTRGEDDDDPGCGPVCPCDATVDEEDQERVLLFFYEENECGRLGEIQ